MVNADPKKIEDVLTRGVDEVIDKDSLKIKLLSGKQLRVKFGIDPTAPDLHLGHSVPLRKLRQFQELGHKVVFLIGDFTASIGDPSGRSTTRKSLTAGDIKRNMRDYIKQAGKILDLKKVEIRYNSEWYKKNSVPLFLELTSQFTYARLIERDDFQKRIKEDIDISMLEMLYPLLQGYDSFKLKADIEIGGRDQKFNLLMGRKVQRKFGQNEQDIITLPLVEGTDGVKKMSKSYGNYIGLSEAPADMFGKVMSIPDKLIMKYFLCLTDVSSQEINDMRNGQNNPRDNKARLAREIVSLYYGAKVAQTAEREFEKIFRNKELPTDVPTFKATKDKYQILDLLADSKMSSSKGEAQRLVTGGGVEIQIGEDKRKVQDWREEVEVKDQMIIRVGRKFIRIRR